MKLQAKRQKIFPYYIFMLLHCHTTNLHINWDLVFTTRFIRLFGIRCFFFARLLALYLSYVGDDDAHSAHIWVVVCVYRIANTTLYTDIQTIVVLCYIGLKLNIMWPPV